MVMCKEPVILAPFKGFDEAYFLRTAIKPGISCSAISISLRPKSASEISATLYVNSEEKFVCIDDFLYDECR